MNKEIIHLAVCVALFILLRYLFGVVPVEALDFLLFPVSKLVGFCLNSPGRFVEGAGYVYEGLQIIIERSCAGGNFLLISFLMTSWFLFMKKCSDRADYTRRFAVILPVNDSGQCRPYHRLSGIDGKRGDSFGDADR